MSESKSEITEFDEKVELKKVEKESANPITIQDLIICTNLIKIVTKKGLLEIQDLVPLGILQKKFASVIEKNTKKTK